MSANQIGRLTGTCASGVVIVAHPDDETLWAGGTLLMCPDHRWTVVTLTRASDPDRAPKFHTVMEHYRAAGVMGDLDDGPEQMPLGAAEVEEAILELLPSHHYNLVLTHGLQGEYTRHRRHEEVARAVVALRDKGQLSADVFWLFAYRDDGGRHLPCAVENSDICTALASAIWEHKYRIITDVYGFQPDSFEARTTPRQEAFWVLREPLRGRI